MADFKEDKHAGMVRVLERIREEQPLDLHIEDGRIYVKYDGGPDKREVTFVVDGRRVFIKN